MSEKQQDESSQQQDISKSSVKKEMLALKKLGEKIVALPESQLKKIPLDEKLLDAIISARNITKHGGLKRQLQYIGKLMRHIDPEPIQNALLDIEHGYQEDIQLFHLQEQWRDHLLMGGDEKLTEFVNQYPSTDLQRLRQLSRNYKSAKTEDKKKHTARLVFKLVKEQFTQEP